MAERSAPRFYVRVRVGSAAPVEITSGITAFKFEDDETKTDKLTLAVDNYDLSALDGPLWVPDNIIEFQFGYPGRMSPPREAVIQKVSGFMQLQVEADSKDALMNRAQRTDRTWTNVKRSDVIKEIVAEYGFTPDLHHIEDTKLVVPSVTQARMTDLQLIKSLAAREGFEFFVDFDGVHFHKRDTKQKPIRTLTYFLGGDITNVTMEVEKRAGKPGAVKLGGKEHATGEAFEVTGDSNSTAGERTALADSTEVGGPEDRIIQQPNEQSGEETLVARPAAGEPAESTATTAQSLVAPTSEPTKAAAQRAANGAYEKQQLRGASLTLTLVMDPLMLAKATVRVEGVGKKLSGNWYVKNAQHDPYAGTTTIKLAREGLNGQGAAVAARKNDAQGPADPSTAAGGGGAPAGTDGSMPMDQVDGPSGEQVYRETGGRFQ